MWRTGLGFVLAVSACRAGGTASSVDAASSAAAPVDASREAATATSAKDAAADAPAGPPTPEEIARGKQLYGRYCNFCHGNEGQGYAADQAPALANDDLLTIASDDYLINAITKGRPGTTMSAWSVARGGPLGYDGATAITSYIRTWQKRPNEVLAKRGARDSRDAGDATGEGGAAATGDITRGGALFAAHCASCHGAKGRDGKYGALANPELLAAASDEFLGTTIERGRTGTPMQAFGAKLPKGGVDDILALLRAWQRPPEETNPADLPPKAGALVSIVMNPGGAQPPFESGAEYIKVEAVKAQFDRKATMIIVDARPPADYARMHVAGAISIPFYDSEPFAKQLPKDRYILTYCGCPHAESGQLRTALKKLGYPRVAVMDEGLLAWRDRGYPVRGGAKP